MENNLSNIEIPEAVDTSNFVDKTSEQTIDGVKTFSNLPLSPVTTTVSNDMQILNYRTAERHFVKLTTAQTIQGVKTFSSIPIAPASNPTTANQLTRKQYVDDSINNAISNIDIPDVSDLQMTKLYHKIIALEDLPAHRFINFNGRLCQTGQKILGVTEQAYLQGEEATLITYGIATVEIGGTININGNEVRSSFDGKAGYSSIAFQNIFNLDTDPVGGELIRVKL